MSALHHGLHDGTGMQRYLHISVRARDSWVVGRAMGRAQVCLRAATLLFASSQSLGDIRRLLGAISLSGGSSGGYKVTTIPHRSSE